MMEYGFVALCAFAASLVSFYSGFGLGTMLMPIVAIFVPLPIAIALTAVVHLLHNLVKTGFLWKEIDRSVVLRFGGAAILAAIPGAWLLGRLSILAPLRTYSFLDITSEVSLLHLLVGGLLILFATLELLVKRGWSGQHLFLGGALSGFFGGLTGNQGAFRSAFLAHSHLGAKTFIGTNAAISVCVDVIRLIFYGVSFWSLLMSLDPLLLATALGGAFVGIFVGLAFLKKVAIGFIQKVIVVLLYGLGILIAMGLI